MSRCISQVAYSSCRRLFLLAGAVILADASLAAQPQPAGRVKTATGSAFIVRAGNTMPAQSGTLVFESDSLRTGSDGRLSVTLKDDTRLSLGSNTELHLDQFAFAPAESRFGFVMKLLQGTLAYVSGRIAKLAPDAIRLETPNSIVGVRGTRLILRAGPP